MNSVYFLTLLFSMANAFMDFHKTKKGFDAPYDHEPYSWIGAYIFMAALLSFAGYLCWKKKKIGPSYTVYDPLVVTHERTQFIP